MKVTYPSSSVCRVNIQGWRNRLFGLFFILLGIGFVSFYLTTSKINCKIKSPGIANACILKEKISGFYHTSSNLGQLLGTKMRTVYNPPTGQNETQGSYSYEVLLLTKNLPKGMFFNQLSYANKNTAIQASQAINQYISASTSPTLSLPRAAPIFTLLFPPIFILVGAYMFFTSRKVQLDLDKNTQQVTITRTSLRGKVEVTTISFTNVNRFFVDSRLPRTRNLNPALQLRPSSNQQHRGQVYGLIMELTDQTRIPITSTYDNSYTGKANAAKQLNEWIHPDGNVPTMNKPSETTPSSPT